MYDRPQARTEGIVSEWIDADLVIYDQTTQTAHSLSAAAASVWQACDGQLPAEQIAGQLGLRPALALQALQELDERGLLDDGRPASPGLSRREAAKRFAQVGGVALAAPLIYSVAVPTAAVAANSCVGQVSTTCTAGSGKKSADAGCCTGECYHDSNTNTKICVLSGCLAAGSSTCATAADCCCSGLAGCNCTGGVCADA